MTSSRRPEEVPFCGVFCQEYRSTATLTIQCLRRTVTPALLCFAGDSSSSAAVLSSDDTDAAMQRQQDLQAAALLLAEVFMVGSGASGAEVMDLAALQRLLFDVFHEDIALFKEYCLQDEDNYNGFVEFMDMHRGAGWELLDRLLRGETAAGELLRTSRFFNRISSDVAVE